ncbi:MAG: hypothetical protein QXE04_02500, partial [Thermoplasmatales archaeon]
ITHLTKGSRYRIVSASSTDQDTVSEGILNGFLSMGEEPALLLDIGKDGKEKLRVIPVNAILYIDIISQSEEKESEGKGDTNYIS